jgi:prepilin-type N-terminal cleavage/methylation domain-containing protein
MRARLRPRESDGFTLSEMIIVLAILGIVLAALTQLFVSANNSAADITSRFAAQQNDRLALDALRRDLHCASTLTPTTGFPVTSITVTLGSYCFAAPAGGGSVTWCTVGSGQRFALWRYVGSSCSGTGLEKADFLTTGQVFTNYNSGGAANGGTRAKLSINLPVDTNLARVGGLYDLQDDIVLRNASRT